MAIPILVGKLKFKTKKEAKSFFKKMLEKYLDNQDISQEDSFHLYNLLKRHPEASQKFGCGVEKFFKNKADHGTSCFWIQRNDGSKTDFSYISCVDAKGKSIYKEFVEACREAVKEDLNTAKRKHFEQHSDQNGKVPCEITEVMISYKEADLDHKPPMTFQVIAMTFVEANHIKPNTNMLSTPQDQQFVTTFKDQDIAQKFIYYHHRIASRTANLRIIKKNENLRLGGSERIRKSKNPVNIIDDDKEK